MEVLAYQICIALIILIIGAFGTKARILVTLVACVFTLVMVFTTWLAILQFFTIFISYSISANLAVKQSSNSDGSYSFKSCILIIIIGIAVIWIGSLLTNQTKKRDAKEINDTTKVEQPELIYQDYRPNPAAEPAIDVIETTIDTTQNFDNYNNDDETGDPLNENLQ